MKANMKYHFWIMLSCLLLATACTEQSKPIEKPQVDVPASAVKEHIENNSELENYIEPENGNYPDENNTEAVTEQGGITKIGIIDLVNQVKENPALAELLNFRTQGRIISIKTDTNVMGDRVAVVGLEHPQYNFYKAKNEFSGYFYCIFTLQDAAQLKKKQAIEFVGNILDIGEHTSYQGEYQFKSKEIYANCYSAIPIAD